MCTANAEVIEESEVKEQKPQEQLASLLYFPSMVYTITKEEFVKDALDVFNENIKQIKKDKNI